MLAVLQLLKQIFLIPNPLQSVAIWPGVKTGRQTTRPQVPLIPTSCKSHQPCCTPHCCPQVHLPSGQMPPRSQTGVHRRWVSLSQLLLTWLSKITIWSCSKWWPGWFAFHKWELQKGSAPPLSRHPGLRCYTHENKLCKTFWLLQVPHRPSASGLSQLEASSCARRNP